MTNALNQQIGGSHYKNFKIQPLEFIHANDLDFLQGNVIKYIVRHKFKNGVEDIDKVIHYANLIKELHYCDDSPDLKVDKEVLYENERYSVSIDSDDSYAIFNLKTGVKEYTHSMLPTSISQADAMDSALGKVQGDNA